MRNHEVTTPQNLLENGNIKEPGWARSLVWKYSRDDIKAPKFRIKEWDYYLIMADKFGMAFTISDDGYIGLQSASLLLLSDEPWEHTETILNAFPMGKFKLPADSGNGVTEYSDKRLQMKFEVLDTDNFQSDIYPNSAAIYPDKIDACSPYLRSSIPANYNNACSDIATSTFDNTGKYTSIYDKLSGIKEFEPFFHNDIYNTNSGNASVNKSKKIRHITCNFENFCNGKPFSCDIYLEQPDMDTLVIATPWPENHRFYYNQKINCMRAKGFAEFDGRKYEFNPDTDFGTLDWGRGVWTYDNTWHWGSGNGMVDGHKFGFNVGYGFGDTTAATENVIFYDGKAHKLDDITFNIPADSYTKPWTLTSSDGRFEMDFVPVLDRAAKIDVKLIITDQHQVFGRLSGKAVLDDGTEIHIKDLMCFFEKVHNKY